jgi:hypothetical protein
VYYATLGNMRQDVLDAGNLTECQTPSVLRKISSEAHKAEDLHRDGLIDVMITQQVLADIDIESHTVKGYIQQISVVPFTVTMYSEAQLCLLGKLQKKGRVNVHIDATGSVCAKMKSIVSDKRMLYYAAVVADEKGSPPVPITGMVSNSHDVPTITNWLMRTIHSTTAIHGHKIRTGLAIVIDFSWAEIQACLQAWNTMSLGQYLNKCYAVVHFKSTTAAIKQLSTVHICAAHMIKSVRDNMSEGVKDKALMQFFMFTFARLQNAATLKQAQQLYESMCVVYTAKYLTATVASHIKILQDIVEKATMDEDTIAEGDDREVEHVELFGNTLRRESPFTKIFDECLPCQQIWTMKM